jgi:integrase
MISSHALMLTEKMSLPNINHLTDFPEIKGWLRSVAPLTGKRYLYYLKGFCSFSRLSPRQLLSLAQNDKMRVKERIADFHRENVGKGYALHTCRNSVIAIRAFLSYNEVRFGKLPISLRADTEYESNRIFTRQEVFRMLVGARSPRDKAIISFVVQSGQRVGVITTIQYGQVRRQIEDSISPVVIDVNPNLSKCNVRHSFAIGQECVDFIKIMMAKRESAGEIIDDESILFRSPSLGWSRIGDEMVYGGTAYQHEKGRRLDTASIGILMRKAAAAGGVALNKAIPKGNFPRWNRYELHPHAFRRWFKITVRRAGVTDPAFLDFILGHRPPYRGAYDTFDHDFIRQEYAKAESQLTFLRNRADLAQGRQEKDSQRIVDEGEATNLFSEGWRFVTTLPSGRLVVQRDPLPRAIIA